ncbi:Nucleoredoxin-like protein 2 Rod-derived cone viability factor 2 [Larimichthys crocea]|uniref:Nucleoredoxin-like protein 2 Rod-derived cone viability factor 2 n=1 Tax=Larimichthys crocea TaxID=215358 RepID=A0A6G0I094_LARCR|nr:Nucleoredoxin-like protein 2 Rod-derived cone viability factor 2 [Larimichthys crocea]
MVEVFTGRTLLNKDGDFVDPEEALRNKVVGIYFSAGWCPPCRDFTPILCDFYTELVEETEPPAQFEIVFISSDKTSDDMVEYYHDMHGDWLALPWTDDYKHELKQRYKITAVPKLVIVKENGDVITDKGRKQIRDRGLACFRLHTPQRYKRSHPLLHSASVGCKTGGGLQDGDAAPGQNKTSSQDGLREQLRGQEENNMRKPPPANVDLFSHKT